MLKRLLFCGLLASSCSTALGTTLEAERDTEYRIAGRRTFSRSFVVVEGVSENVRKHLRPGFGAEQVATVLRRSRVQYRIRIKPNEGWSNADAVRPKLVFSAEYDESAKRTEFSLSLVIYVENEGTFTPQLIEKKDLTIEGPIASESRGIVARFLSRSTYRLLGELRREAARGPIRLTGFNAGNSVTLLDRDLYRGKLFVGLAAGTPAIVNAQFGYWGSRSFPVSFVLSGGYLSMDYRGAEAALSWVADNEGEWRHAFGMAAGVYGTSLTSETQEKDSLGRVIKLTRVTTKQMEFAAGPFYQIHWNSFSLSGGCRMLLRDKTLIPHVQLSWRLPL
ncbi:MAG: hypothetical protein KDD51_05065 [Bdellovibrionales bacterium]|nr:hypothetical protein [Bdellovibrionales bacterium]